MIKMKSKERVKRAFHFDKPDRIPKTCFSLSTDFFIFPLFDSKKFQPAQYPPHVSGGPNAYKSLFNRYLLLQYHWERKHRKNLGLPRKWWYFQEKHIETIDEWGVVWSSGQAGSDITMGHPIKGPFTESWDALDDFIPPDPNDQSRYRFWRGVLKILGKNRYILGTLYIGFINNLSSWLRGFDKIMIDYVRNPKQIHKVNEIIAENFCKEIQIMKEKCPKLDALFALDDLGTQKSPIISPKTFRKFYFEPYKKVIDLTHDLGMDFILHSCGQIKELLPVFIDLNVDVMEFDSPNMTGVENFKQYAEQQRMAFLLSSNIQTTFSQGTPAEIENELKYYIKEVGNNQGGLGIYEYLDHKVLGVPKENVKALHRAIKKYGNYNAHGKINWLE